MGSPEHHVWCVSQPDAPDLVRSILEDLVARGGGELVLGSIFNELIGWEPSAHQPEPETDDVAFTIKFDDAQLRELLRLLGTSDPDGHVAELGGGALELVLTPDHDGDTAWLIVAEFAEDIGPNNGSWPLSRVLAEFIATRLGGHNIDDQLN